MLMTAHYQLSVGAVLLLILHFVSVSNAQQAFECPKEWLSQGSSCYMFKPTPPLTVQEAQLSCLSHKGQLLSVESNTEHDFIHKWLEIHDKERQSWWTSGVRKAGKMIWTSSDTEISDLYFPNDEVKDERKVDSQNGIEHRRIVYTYDKESGSYVWGWGRVMEPGPYICEIHKDELWKLHHSNRDFSFGTGLVDPRSWPIGPNITDQSGDVVFFQRSSGSMTSVDVFCQATGNPQPSYRWYKMGAGGKMAVLPPATTRYTIINGQLNIQSPSVELDVGQYYCEASNSYGTVLSNPITLSLGKLMEFSPVATSPYTSRMYMGIEIDCKPPTYTAATFNWFKDSTMKFIRPELNPQMFVSRNGKLYISEVTESDAGNYFCQVTLSHRQGETLASRRKVSRTSRAIRLRVIGDTPNTYGPDIQDRFPQVFPKVPMVGQKLVIECLAYGRLPLVYSWTRDDGPMNPKVHYLDSNRVLIIDEARFEDTGSYTCRVEGKQSTTNRTRHITLSAEPSFPLPLENQFPDKGAPFTWSCYSQGIPVPTYSWYKDGVKLEATNTDLGITIRGRHMDFKTVESRHDGVYQCEAVNVHGVRRNSAQLRAVSFKPTFERIPVVSIAATSTGGSLTVQCTPEAAPRPTITWSKDSGGMGGNARMLPSGALELSDMTIGDEGTYTCNAENSLGSASSSVQITVSKSMVLTEKPTSDQVPINGSTTLRCKASYNHQTSDVIYTWKFYDHVIDFDVDISYTKSKTQSEAGALYLISAQNRHEGTYTCIASTVTQRVEAEAFISIIGPPDEPSGVHKHGDNPTPSSLELWWLPGHAHVHPVTSYRIEVNADGDDQWIVATEIDEEAAKIMDEQYFEWRRTTITEGLFPGGSFRFRVRAGSDMGYSVPSTSSGSYKMADAAPITAPTGVTGGGGKERELQIRWQPLPRKMWGADNIMYNVFYRLNQGGGTFNKWQVTEKLTKTEFHTVVSPDLYYSPYEVKVQAINRWGSGPNSTEEIVYSADMMPSIKPNMTSRSPINSTAGIVNWDPVPNRRDFVGGSILAFQVNYWLEDSRCQELNIQNYKFNRVYDAEATSLMLVGLDIAEDYCVNVQLLNHAGLGPKGDAGNLGLNYAAPTHWPEYVTISSHGPESVRVTWRGVYSSFVEETLIGYKAWYWKLQEDIRSAQEVDFGHTLTGVIHGIEDTGIYKLRIMAYSNGGYGKKAPDVLFTLADRVYLEQQTTEVMNTAPTHNSCNIVLLIGVALFILLNTQH